jgi:MFS transporter, PAT family, beta-lactamase induction signal transducer AmpG
VTQQKLSLPVWLASLTGASFGMAGGFIIVVLPQMLAARHVPEPTIASVTAAGLSPGFYSFLLSPALDVRFSRRFYATVLTFVSAAALGSSVFQIDNVWLLTVNVMLGMAAIQLAQSALYAWLLQVTRQDDAHRLSAWVTVTNIGGGGLMAAVGGEMVAHFALGAAAALIAGMIVLPVALFPWIPAPRPDQRHAGESFRQFFASVLALLKRREVLFGIALFVAPCGTFTLTNMLGGLGGDFHASAREVSLLLGAGGVIAGACGSLLLPPLAKRLALRPLYLAIGLGGAVFTFVLILLPRTPGTFFVAAMGENLVQAVEIAGSIAIAFEIMGKDNPLAATTCAILTAAYNVPISYMLVVDGRAFGRGGVAGAFAVDAGLGVVACAVMALVLWRFGRAGEVESAQLGEAVLELPVA